MSFFVFGLYKNVFIKINVFIKNVFLFLFIFGQAAVSQRLNYVSCHGG